MKTKKKAKRKKFEDLTLEQWDALVVGMEIAPYVMREIMARAQRGNRSARSILNTAHRMWHHDKTVAAYKKLLHGRGGKG